MSAPVGAEGDRAAPVPVDPRRPTPVAGTAPPTHVPYRGATVLGLVLLGLGPALSALVEVAVFGRDGLAGLVFAGPLVAAAWLWALVVRRGGAWARALAMGLAVLQLGVYGVLAGNGLRYADSALDFLPVLTVAVGAGLTVVAGAASLVRGAPSADAPSRAERRLAVAVLAGLGLAAAWSIALTVVGGETVDEAAARFAVDVDLVDFRFAPGTIEAPTAGRLLVHNADPVLHTFTVPALGIDRVVGPGGDVLIELDDVPAGRWAVYCKPHADESEPDADRAGMAGWLVTG